jgi:hypothetical protein
MYEHHMVHHGGRGMTIKIYLIEAVLDADLQTAGGRRVPASNDGNLQQLQMANATVFWSPLLAASSMNATMWWNGKFCISRAPKAALGMKGEK